MKGIIFFCFFLSIFLSSAIGQCPYTDSYLPKSKGIIYDIQAKLNTTNKSVAAKQTITWKNTSDKPVMELRFYMYLNAFRDMKSSFLKDSNGEIFGRKLKEVKKDEWAFIAAGKFKVVNSSDTLHWKYIQPNDGNVNDATVLLLQLQKPIQPNETIKLEMDFVSKLPGFMVRSGYSRDEFYSFLHWFPQLGVYEKNAKGEWAWNCHQFFQQTEFYADFADFNIELDVTSELVIGYSGCLNFEKYNSNTKRKQLSITAKDAIDFAWIAYPFFETYETTWKGINVKLLIPPEHCTMAPRYEQAIKNALAYFELKLGKYPYPSITLIDPPMHGLGSGFMEYPMLITCASFHYVPKGIRTIEALAIHEFSHQYFMAIVATNEKEEAWMDEGFVTFFEDEIMDHYYGSKNSVWDIFGFKSGNKEQSRLEYTSIAKLNVGKIARPGWEIEGKYYKDLIYGKTATVLQTLKGLLTEEKFYQVLKTYYQKYKFKHPKEKDFIASVKEVVGDEIEIDFTVDEFFHQTLHTTDYCDYKIESIVQSKDNLYRLNVSKEGRLSFPQEINITYTDGNDQVIYWDGRKNNASFDIETLSEIKSVTIDPNRKIYMDINFNNNSYTPAQTLKPAINFGTKSMSWFQFIIQSIGFLA